MPAPSLTPGGLSSAQLPMILETLKSLSNRGFKKFRYFVQETTFQKSLQKIPHRQRHHAGRAEIVDLMMKAFGQQSVEVARDVFMIMNRTDLVQNLPETSSGQKGDFTVKSRNTLWM
uniref:Pyrin domain-containing protein n=1 Tax=Acanthochromis polyacanthus TaxID=80966 RepID=A0A3Q1EE08_9TELE